MRNRFDPALRLQILQIVQGVWGTNSESPAASK